VIGILSSLRANDPGDDGPRTRLTQAGDADGPVAAAPPEYAYLVAVGAAAKPLTEQGRVPINLSVVDHGALTPLI